MSASGWGNDCIQFKLPHKPIVAGLDCEWWQYNKPNFTLLYYCCKYTRCSVITQYRPVLQNSCICVWLHLISVYWQMINKPYVCFMFIQRPQGLQPVCISELTGKQEHCIICGSSTYIVVLTLYSYSEVFHAVHLDVLITAERKGSLCIIITAQKATIHQVTTMLATSNNVLFTGHNCVIEANGHQVPVVSRWLWFGNRTFLEVASMVHGAWCKWQSARRRALYFLSISSFYNIKCIGMDFTRL